jgi:hypothetical protein
MKTKSLFLVLISIFTLMILTACTQPKDDATTAIEVNDTYEVVSNDYAEMGEKALQHLANLDLDSWGAMLADDAEFYFPDGDEGTRTVLKGKKAILDWWANWKQTSGIKSMTASNTVHVPVAAKKTLNYTGLSGTFVLSYFSNALVYETGQTSIRMHFAAHFNDQNLIDRYYTYYDRSLIIEAMGVNILKPE